MNKVLIWNRLQKRNWEGYDICALFKLNDETNGHLIMDCDYSKQVWKEVDVLLGLKIF